MSPHVLTILGWVLLLGGLGIFLIAELLALLRIQRQYSRSMHGAGGLYLGAAITAALRLWPSLVVAIAGAALLLLSR